MTDKFDINSLSKEQQGSPASYKQCQALAIRFAKKGSMVDWKLKGQIFGCLYSDVKQGNLTCKQASDLFNKKSLPKNYKDAITKYLAEHDC